MAGNAIDCGMRTDQREAVFVSAYRLQGYIPADHAVALLAIGAELPPMNIGMAVGAVRADVAEYRFGMALHAVNLCMHAPQRIAGRVVIEFGNRADRFPTRLCVAVLAWNGQGSVRAARLGIGRTTILSQAVSLKEDKREHENERQQYPLEHERSVLRTWIHVPLAGKRRLSLGRDPESNNCTDGQ